MYLKERLPSSHWLNSITEKENYGTSMIHIVSSQSCSSSFHFGPIIILVRTTDVNPTNSFSVSDFVIDGYILDSVYIPAFFHWQNSQSCSMVMGLISGFQSRIIYYWFNRITAMINTLCLLFAWTFGEFLRTGSCIHIWTWCGYLYMVD
jgi:hypothetical protein